MKHFSLLFSILFTIIFLYSCNTKTNEVRITGTLTGVEDGAILSLFEMNDGMIEPFATDTVKNGRFSFSYTDSVLEVKRIGMISHGEGFPPTYATLWIAPGADMQISGEDKLYRTWDIKSNVAEQQEQSKYVAKSKEYQHQTQRIMISSQKLFKQMRETPEKSGDLRKQIDSLYAINDSLEVIIARNELDMLKENPTYSNYWIDLLYVHSMSVRHRDNYPYKDDLLALYNQLPQDKKETKTGKLITLNLFPPTIVGEGDEMADADLYDMEGKLKHLADFKGKYIMLDFWSAGCGPCIAAMPEMRELAEIYKDKLEIVGLSVDTKKMWEMISKEKDITWNNLNDLAGNDGIAMRYGVSGFPNYVMISPDGIILKKWMGYGEGSLKAKMKELIK